MVCDQGVQCDIHDNKVSHDGNHSVCYDNVGFAASDVQCDIEANKCSRCVGGTRCSVDSDAAISDHSRTTVDDLG